MTPSAISVAAQDNPALKYEYAPDKPGETRSADIKGKKFVYRVVDGLAVTEGDMVLGPVEEVEEKIKKAKDDSLSPQSFGATDFLGNYLFWPNGQIYYSFDSTITSSKRAIINEAIEHWQDATMLRFYPRSSGARIVFKSVDTSCSSNVGYPAFGAGVVNTNIGPNCGLAETIHEVGHAVALNHEHSRCDRDNFIGIYSGRATGQGGNLDRYCSSGAQQSTYDAYSVMHYPKWVFARDYYGCVGGNDAACTILPDAGSGIDKNRMGESVQLTSRDASGIFNYYRDQSPCVRNAGGCTWRGFTVGGTRGGSFDFTLSASDQRYMVIQGNQVPVAGGLNRRRADGTYENLQFRIIPTNGSYKFSSGTLPPGSYRWYVHADNANTSGSVDMFPID